MSRHVTYYFRSTDPDVVQAYLNDVETAATIERQGNNFAALFGARAYYSIGLETRFIGVSFDKEYPCRWPDCWQREKDPFWGLKREQTVPDRAIESWRKLKALWDANWPEAAAAPRRSELLQKLGIEAATLDGHALAFSDRPGELYAYSSMVIPGLEEITASQYMAGIAKEKRNG